MMQKTKVNYAKKHAKDFNILTRLYQFYALYILFKPFCALFYKLCFTKNKSLNKEQKFLFAANHISYCDPFLLALAVDRPLSFMAKKELFESDYLAKNISRLGSFAVNREKLEVSTIKSTKEVFKAGWNLGIFPQGGIRKNKKIEEINKGFVAVAKLAKVDIVPVSIAGLEKYNWRPFIRQKVEVKVGTPISYLLDDDEIMRNWCSQICTMSGYDMCQVFD